MPAVMWGHLPPLVEIGLTDMPKPGWAIAHSAYLYPTPLNCEYFVCNVYRDELQNRSVGVGLQEDSKKCCIQNIKNQKRSLDYC